MNRAAPLLLVLLLPLLSCTTPEEPAPITFETPLGDPQVVTLDARTPSTYFDGRYGSLLTGAGWAPPELEDPIATSAFHFAWVLDGVGTLWLPALDDEPLDFWGICQPFNWPEAPDQTLTLLYKGRELGRHTLDEGWQEFRLPLPQDLPRGTPFELELHFDRATRPSDVTPDRPDNRRLSAACRTLAIVPRDLEDVASFLEATSLAAEPDGGRQLQLPSGGAVEWPLPPGVLFRLRLGEVSSSCSSCTLSIRSRTGSTQTEFWTGPASEASTLALQGETPGPHPTRLRLDWSADGSPSLSASASKTLRMQLPEDFLTTEPEDITQTTPPIFLYLVDTLRADLVEREDLAPAIAEFTRDAVTYERAWSASAWTLPSVVSILTGVYPHRHGIHRGDIQLSDDLGLPPVATRLGDVGYDTLAVSQSLVASARFGIDTGFDRFFFSNQLNSWSLRSQELRRSLLRHLLHRANPEAPLFAYLHSVGPHAPYAPLGDDRRFAKENPGTLDPRDYLPHKFMRENLGDDPQEVEHLEALYHGEVAYADRHFGHFLDLLRHLDLYDDSLIVMVSDHGEEFGEHGGFDHGRTLYEEMIRVPLYIKFPGQRFAGESVQTRVSTVDLVPTLLVEAGVDPATLPLDGSPLQPDILAERPRNRRLTFSEVHPARSAHAEAVSYRALALDDLKCLESLVGRNQFGDPVPPLRAYDLSNDPREQQPLTAEGSTAGDALDRCRRLLDQWITQLDSLPAIGSEQETTPETLDKLRALGYID